MLTYLVRRLATAALILLGASFVVYNLTALSGDPLEEFRGSGAPNARQLMDARAELLDLGTPAPLRYFTWLGGAARCLIPIAGGCDLGKNVAGQPVTEALGVALVQTLTLVTAAAVLAILVGVALGVVTALRQHSALDYGVTFMAFLFFSLPIFWVAVLLKEYGAIGFNDFLADPEIPWQVSAGLGALAALSVGGVVGGRPRRRLAAGGTAFVLTAGLLALASATRWFARPGLGLIVLLVAGTGFAFAAAGLAAGPRNRRALVAGLAAVAVGLAVYFPIQVPLNGATPGTVLVLGAVTVLVGAGLGWLAGGYDRRQNMRVAVATALAMAAMTALDRYMQAWPSYVADSTVRGRPIATIGASTPNLGGDFWTVGIDSFTHLVLPTIALVLVSLAGYARFTRSSMLEVMTMDYIRTARAKGVGERDIVLRHALRNALLPITTVVAFDIGGLIGGAVITETVFSVRGMGVMFLEGVTRVDPNPVMAVFICTAATAMVFNILADLAYSALDPRIRVR
ncbi:ABC transporter permease [Sinomonas sp. R1AF57]|uniref:ABC transporter permease n=1 Tax=Sinomonas sp. R1AF57 TaxID=2020377 RepID=UPI000B5DC51C|nr:ABC transporter permease [Sinomonas sp. R1AF57]ASN52491.1 ABC transporter permease [Sinomonas sp. R1AF57]